MSHIITFMKLDGQINCDEIQHPIKVKLKVKVKVTISVKCTLSVCLAGCDLSASLFPFNSLLTAPNLDH